MTKPVRRKNRFTLSLLAYALILMLVCGLLLFVFHRYIDAYEASLPQGCIDAYTQGLKGPLPTAGREALAKLETGSQSEEENLRWAEELVHGAALVKDYVKSTDERQIYRLRAEDGRSIGTVTFAVTGTGRYRLPVWEKVEEEMDFSAYCKTVSVTVPAAYRVYLGDRLLGPECVVEQDIPYAALEECYLHYEGLPTMLRYESPPFLGDPVLRILDEKGVELGQDELTEERFLDNVSPEIRERTDEFVSRMIPAYVLFSADIQGHAKDYFNPLMAYVVPDSQLHTVLLQALENAGWGKTQTLKVSSIRLNSVTDLGDGRYLADVTYDSDLTTVWGGAAHMTDNARVVILDRGGTLKADAVYHY